MDNNNTCGALHYMLRAKELFEAANDVDSLTMTLEHLVDLMEQEGNLDYALNYTLLQIELYGSLGEKETVEVLKDSANHYKHVLGGELKAEEKATLSEAYHCVPSTYIDPNYQQLCKGETVVTEHTDKKPLHCHLYTNNNHPLLRLSPAKIEEINTAFGLNFAHDVLTEREIELLKQAASSKFEASKIVTYDKKTDNFIIQPQSRSSNTGWVFDDENKVIREMSKRVATILDVDVDSAEAYQVLSYGIGGFYTPHHDWGSGDDPFPGHGGNRIATWIFYLNDVKEGGATVFPRIGAAVWPEKGGAAFWRNVYYNGTPNDLNLHAACPVLKGYKWASNKWFHQHRNEFKWPCKLDSEL
ncbi:P4HA1 [Bugula neritina]|uniref:P4HA1 n=1 Tax=Bugula neritina TaxID=10212 RepID=A0A7J7ITQ4_BUGNE|nr:P4HA1 [Bugula neritina]